MKKFLLIMIMNCFAWTAFAQFGSITGKVMDGETNEEMIGVTVIINGTSKGSITDLDGVFTISRVAPGSHELRISYVGYEEVKLDISVSADQTTDIGVVTLGTNVIGLKQVEVFAAISEDRATPIAVSSIKAEMIEERFAGLDLPDMVNNIPGVYAIQGAGGFGDQEVYIRGFDQTNVAFLVNGIPVNDMENGRMYWSNFAGLSDVTRRMEVQRGLGASRLAISSLGGTVNMITKPNEARKGGRLEHQIGNGTWNNRTRFSFHTGEGRNGWSISFQGSRFSTNSNLIGLPSNQQGGYVPGAFVDAWSYYLGIHKKVNNQHSFMFTAFGAPVNRGTAFNTFDDVYERAGTNYFNQATGYYNGDFFNARQNYAHKPQISLAHYWDIDKNTSLTTSAYISVADVYSTQFRKSEGGGLQYEVDAQGLYVDFDGMAAFNRAQTGASQNGNYGLLTVNNPGGQLDAPPITGYASQYFLEARHNDHFWYGVISTFNKKIDNWNITAGIDLRDYQAAHYATLFDAFGGDFVLDRDRRTYRDNNKLAPNNVIFEGDRFNYDYDGHVRWGAAFGQAEYTIGKFDVFSTVTLSSSQMWRTGHMWNANFPQNSLGESEKKRFNNYNLKFGGNYRITGRNSIYANLGHFTRAPFLTTAFQNPRYIDDYIGGITSESLYAAEMGYRYVSAKLRLNVNAYYTEWQNRAVKFQNIQDGVEYYYGTSNQDALHMGIEADVSWNILPTLEFTGYASFGDWRWKGVTDAVVTNNIDQTSTNITVYADDFPVGNAAQTTAGGGLHYTGVRDMYFGARVNHFDRLWVRFNPEDYPLPNLPAPARLPAYQVVDIYFGKYFRMGDIRGRFSGHINNVFDTEFVRWGSVFAGNIQKAYGFGRNYTLGLSFSF